MITEDISAWCHDHVFDKGNIAGERGTRSVLLIAAVMMGVEILAGWWYNSMALLAEGFHMSSHVVAIGLSALAYAVARKQAADQRFAFGTWKIEVLGGFASAIILLVIAVLMVVGSIEHLISPSPIGYQEAIVVAVFGLLVNILSAVILHSAHYHEHGSHRHRHHENGDDLNLRSAYTHVLTDAVTSLLAIFALAGGLIYGWAWLDPTIGLFGALLVALWARRLIMDTSKVLLDREMDNPVVKEIRESIEKGGMDSETSIVDLHVWRVGKVGYSCAASVLTYDRKLTPEKVRAWLIHLRQVVHTTIEINQRA